MRQKRPLNKREFKSWIITIDGDPVEGTTAGTRDRAIKNFTGGGRNSWATFREAGYAIERAMITLQN